jgi:predicted transcriptional regulator YdeE
MSTPEKYFIDKDIKVVCVKADSFPEGIGAAWQKLFSMLPNAEQRKLYGVSYGGENGKVIYRAGAEALHAGEADQLQLETFTVKHGEYIAEVLKDWRNNESQIGKIFHELLSDPRIDKKQGYCLEIYFNQKDVRCLVLLNSSNEPAS